MQLSVLHLAIIMRGYRAVAIIGIIVVLIVALPAVSTLLNSGVGQPEPPDSTDDRILAAVYDLNTTDYTVDTFRTDRSSGDRLEPVSVVKIENSAREVYVVTPSRVPSSYQHRSLVWGYNNLASQWEFATVSSYCERRSPFIPHELRSADRTVINASETNTTVRYERRVTGLNLDNQILNTTVSLDAEDRIDTVV